MNKDEALKLALEALEWMVANDDTNEGDEPVERLGGQSWNEYNAYWLNGLNNSRAAITAIKQALAAPVQEPVGEWVGSRSKDSDPKRIAWKPGYVMSAKVGDKIYTTPPAAQRQRVVFPTMLRKMWSGGEVQAWLDENVNKENT